MQCLGGHNNMNCSWSHISRPIPFFAWLLAPSCHNVPLQSGQGSHKALKTCRTWYTGHRPDRLACPDRHTQGWGIADLWVRKPCCCSCPFASFGGYDSILLNSISINFFISLRSTFSANRRPLSAIFLHFESCS